MGKLAAGTVFGGDFRVVAPLSEGGMGAVYVVEQLSTSKRRALKLMRADLVTDDAMRQRFVQEARIGAKIASDHVVEVVAAGVGGEDGATPYLVMELLEGEVLGDYVRHEGAIPPADVLGMMRQVCHAVGAAHAAGVVHRDLKPENIFLARSQRADSAWTVKVLDFGIAKLLAEGITNDTAAMGSPIWLAPEQTERAAVTPATDVWSLALIVFHLLTGRYFWRSADGEHIQMARLLREVVLEPIPSASTRAVDVGSVVPAGFDEWFARCVQRDSSARFGDARIAFAALDPILAGAEPPPVAPPAHPPWAPSSLALAATEAGPGTSIDPHAGLAATEVDTTGAGRATWLARACVVATLAAGPIWVFASGYNAERGLGVATLGGPRFWLEPLCFLVGVAVVVRRARLAPWLALLTCAAATLNTYVGWHFGQLAWVARAPVSQQFQFLRGPLWEGNVHRFAGFALAAALVAASMWLRPKARSREDALRSAGAGAFAFACVTLSVLIRAEAPALAGWMGHTRSERVEMIARGAHDVAYSAVGLALVGLALAGLAVWWVRSLPGPATLRSLVGGHAALLAASLGVVVVDGAFDWHCMARGNEAYAQTASELQLFDRLDPPASSLDLPRPPSAPTLKLSRQRVSLDATAVGLVAALDKGSLDAVLLADLSHRLAETFQASDPPLLVLADRAVSSTTLTSALRIVLRAGVTRVGMLWTRGQPPVFHADDPPEAAWIIPKDFLMIPVTLASCPVVVFDWSTLAPDADAPHLREGGEGNGATPTPNATVCVGPA